MRARLVWPLSVAVISAACFPGYQARVVTGDAKTEFVPTDKYESTPKAQAQVSGNAITVSVMAEKVCYGQNVTTTPQKRVYERKGVPPAAGIAAGAVSAALFGFMFAQGICDPTDQEKLGGTQGACDILTSAGTLVGFGGTLAYGATSIKTLVNKPTDEELPAESTAVETKQACGSDPITNTPLLVYLPTDKSLAYAWPNGDGTTSFDLDSLIDPSAGSGKALIAFATAPDKPIATLEAEALASLRSSGWGPMPTGTSVPMTATAQIVRAHYDISDVNDNVRKIVLKVKVKNTSTTALTARAKIASESPALNGRSVVFGDIAPGAEIEKEVSVEQPKVQPEPSRIDVFLVDKPGALITRGLAKTGPEEAAVTPPTPPTTPEVVTPPAGGKGGKGGKGGTKPK